MGLSRSTWHYRTHPRELVADPVPHTDRAYRSRISATDRSVITERITTAWAEGNSVDHACASAWDAGVMLASRRSWWRVAANIEDQTARPDVPTKHRSQTPREMPVLEATGPGQVWSWDIVRHEAPFNRVEVRDRHHRSVAAER